MNLKKLFFLTIILTNILVILNISCSEQDKNSEKKLTREEQEILKFFEPMSSEWLHLLLYGRSYTERLEKVKEYAAKNGNLSILVGKALHWKDINLIKFLLEQENLSELFYKNIELAESNDFIIGTIKYDLSNTNLDTTDEEYIRLKEVFNLISYDKYLKENKNVNNNLLSELLPITPLPKDLIKIITDYYITHYEEFCNKNQNLIDQWRKEFAEKKEKDFEEYEIERELKKKLNNNKSSSRCKKCIIQ